MIAYLIPLAALVLVPLKLAEVIDWSWAWVLLPLWGPFAALVFAFFVVTALGLLDDTTEGDDGR